MIEKPTRILFDWGGTLCKDSLLFEYYLKNSSGFNFKGNQYSFRPDFWEIIKDENEGKFFFENQEKVFDISELYCDSINTVNKFNGTVGMSSEYENYIVFDYKPELKLPQEKIQLLFAKTLQERGIKANGIYVNADKVSLAKTIGVDFIVDDDPRIIIALAAANIKSILVSRLWNRSFCYNDLFHYVSMKKREIVANNIFIAEDFNDIERIVRNQKTQGDINNVKRNHETSS